MRLSLVLIFALAIFGCASKPKLIEVEPEKPGVYSAVEISQSRGTLKKFLQWAEKGAASGWRYVPEIDFVVTIKDLRIWREIYEGAETAFDKTGKALAAAGPVLYVMVPLAHILLAFGKR